MIFVTGLARALSPLSAQACQGQEPSLQALQHLGQKPLHPSPDSSPSLNWPLWALGPEGAAEELKTTLVPGAGREPVSGHGTFWLVRLNSFRRPADLSCLSKSIAFIRRGHKPSAQRGTGYRILPISAGQLPGVGGPLPRITETLKAPRHGSGSGGTSSNPLGIGVCRSVRK